MINHQQLKGFVDYAREHQAIIIYDAVSSPFIRTAGIPHSIYEIEGAKECAIEIGSFSKIANYTGLRVGWCIVPHQLIQEDSSEGELNAMWRYRQSIKGWGGSNIAQYGALAVLSEQGQLDCRDNCEYYLENARILRNGFEKIGLTCYGGENIPLLWLKTPDRMSSWQFFEFLLNRTGIAGIPGSFFGKYGEGYLRLSTFSKRSDIESAVKDGLSQLDSMR
ncbi:aspartate aminotransferase [Beggiatoa sp. SS]|nr:aspartate aminotransferase [Beggiatoa sp. SS]